MGRVRYARTAGSPAWAGIDLNGLTVPKTLIWFPRVGGDRPTSVPDVSSALLVPPRGRG